MSSDFKQEKLRDFTVIRNAIFKDYTLSAKAVGVACKLLSLPPTWEYSIKGIVALFNDGESSIRSALTELENAGYLRRERVREQGKLGKCVYVITDTLKREKPNVENPHVVNPLVDNQAQLNTKELNTNKSTTNELYISEFENLWKLYPRKQGKENALKDYIKARKSGVSYQEIEDGIKAYVNYINVTKTETQYIKHGSTFFHQKSWKDDWTVDAGYSTASTKESFEEMMARL